MEVGAKDVEKRRKRARLNTTDAEGYNFSIASVYRDIYLNTTKAALDMSKSERHSEEGN